MPVATVNSMRISAPSSRVQITRLGIEDRNIAGGDDVAGGDLAGTLLLQDDALGTLARHLDRDVLDIEHDIRHVLAHARDRRELMQDTVDLDRGNRRALQRRQENSAQRIAEGEAKAALERLRDDRRHALWIVAGNHFELARLDKLLPVLLNHERTFP